MPGYTFVVVVGVLTALCLLVGLTVAPFVLAGTLILIPLLSVGVHDLLQTRHSLRRNYPLVGRMRWLFEGIRPELRQYLLEGDDEPVPFSREQRTLAYERAKGDIGKRPFGTHLDVNRPGHAWLAHSMAPKDKPAPDFRVTIGAGEKAYDASILNISAMSFGALSANAIRALNKGAALGHFAHDTGEGSISRYHREFGGDLIWELGSGYFGCCDGRGEFDPGAFAEQAAADQVKMIEIKLSQGAKPGHGGVLPAAKITPEIAEARRVPMGQDCVSPPYHRAFSTPLTLMAFIARLRELSGGKPVGCKLCIGQPWEFLAMAKAMLATGITPDFIVVDGAEGGTGAAPLEFANNVGVPLRDGLVFARDVLVGTGLRERVRLAASGKLISGFDLAQALALGADWCNSARGFMFALGCIQAQSCHTNRCPVGVATQDVRRQRALDVEDKARRVVNFHHHTLDALAELLAAAGLDHPRQLRAAHIQVRQANGGVVSLAEAYPAIEAGALLAGKSNHPLAQRWQVARAESFALAA